jgi:hypothetical protein
LLRPLLQVKLQVPLLQVGWPPGGASQNLPQVPQCPGLFCVLTQAPPQFSSGDVHDTLHTPPEHTWLAAHDVPQLPQFFGSLCVLTQVLPQIFPA